jgi:hypothetical protein|tara:strand:- start:253 stop:414 length:162 start_codon:yes stop_codon:yes gene_type:complete
MDVDKMFRFVKGLFSGQRKVIKHFSTDGKDGSFESLVDQETEEKEPVDVPCFG